MEKPRERVDVRRHVWVGAVAQPTQLLAAGAVEELAVRSESRVTGVFGWYDGDRGGVLFR